MTLLKIIGPPGSLTFLALGLALCAVIYWLRPSHRRLARAMAAALVALYLVLALPIVSNVIGGGAMARATALDSVPATHVIVVLDGDNRRGRARAAQALLAKSPAASLVLLGERWIVEALAEAGVARDRMTIDGGAATTRAQIDQVRAMAARRAPGARIAVVASRLQMPRVAGLAGAAGLDVDLVASPVDDEPPTSGATLVWPMYRALRVSRDGLYERLALRYYRWKGWIDGDSAQSRE